MFKIVAAALISMISIQASAELNFSELWKRSTASDFVGRIVSVELQRYPDQSGRFVTVWIESKDKSFSAPLSFTNEDAALGFALSSSIGKTVVLHKGTNDDIEIGDRN